MIAFKNNVKTVLLLGGLSGLLVGVGAMLGAQFIVPFLIIMLIMNVGAWFFSDKVAIKAMKGRELDEHTGGSLYAMLVEMSERAGLPKPPRLYLSPHQAPNAFATGRSPSHAAVCFTQGAIDLLDGDELRGVMAHELAHIKNRDTLISTVSAVIAGVLAFVAQFGFFLGGNREGGNPLLVLLVTIIAAVGAAVIKGMISRAREFVADHDGAVIAGSPHGLISALQKLESLNRRVPMREVNPAANNLFIVEPMLGSVSKLFATHPPTEDRIAALQRMG